MNGFKESSWFGGGEASQQVDFAFGVCPTVSHSSHPHTSDKAVGIQGTP